MYRWIPYAFVRIVVCFMAGIVAGIYWPEIASIKVASATFFILLLLYILVWTCNRVYGLSIFNAGYIGLPAVIVAGFIKVWVHTEPNHLEHLVHVPDSISALRLVITQPGEEKEKSWQHEAEVRLAYAGGAWRPVRGKVIMYLLKQEFHAPYQYGDVLIVKGTPQPINAPANPYEFNYKQFLSFKNIYHQVMAARHDVHFVEHRPPSAVIEKAITLRQWATKQMHQYVTDPRAKAVVSALVLGVKDSLDSQLLKAYSSTGAMHVLAVSGLHVGILYFILAFLLKPLHVFRYGKVLMALICIVVLWSYAFVAGLSPSVLRAVTMFSFFAAGMALHYRTNIFNILAVSAFVLLLINPYLLMSVGFQLSYLAVIGIVYLQPRLYRLWEPENILLDKVWQIACVSLAAQMSTFSVGLLYFHQFPNYFLLSNLIVIPAAFLVLVAGLVVVAFSFVPLIAGSIGYLLSGFIRLLNHFVLQVESLPYSVIENVHINTLQCWLLIAMVSALVAYLQRRSWSLLVVTFVLTVLFSTIQWVNKHRFGDQARITVYRIAGHTAFDLIDRGIAYTFADSALASDDDKTRFHIQPNRLVCRVATAKPLSREAFQYQMPGARLIAWRGQTVLHIYDHVFALNSELQVDYVIISNNALRNPESTLSILRARHVILDSSNTFSYCVKLSRACENLTVNMYSVLHTGAYDQVLI